MGDNFDPCECIWNHELSMRRLLSFIRNSQSHCTDTECFPDGSSSNQTVEQSVFFMSLFIMFAMFMYFMRPSAQRNLEFDNTKPRMNGNGSNDTPPRPPPTNL